MVAQVIKLASVATNNFQSQQSAVTNDAVSNSQQQLQAVQEKARKIAEQAAQNIDVVRNAVSDLNGFAEEIQTNLRFSVDEGSGRSIITVTDKQTGDVIRQIPAKEILAVANIIRESAAANLEKVGLLLAEQG